MNNIEKLRNYFLGKDPQLKETMADNSLRLIGIPGKEFVLKAELYKRLTDLKKQVDDKDEELQANIDNVVEALSGEQEARMADDEALQENIDREAEIRNDADARLAADLHELGLTVDDILDWANTSDFIYANDLETRLLNYYTKAQVDELISVIPKFSIEVVQSLPTQDISADTIYLLAKQDGSGNDYYDEYIYIGQWEKIGSTQVDLTNYYTKNEADAQFAENSEIQFVEGMLQLVNDKTSSVIGGAFTATTDDLANSYTAAYPNFSSIKFQVLKDEMILVSGKGGNTATTRLWAFYNANGNIIAKADADAVLDNMELQAPADGYLIMNFTDTTTYPYSIVSTRYKTMEEVDTEIKGKVSKDTIATSITSSSTNNEVAGAKAVYDSLPANFTGTDGVNAGTSGLVPTPETTDVDKYLKSDGTWESVAGGIPELDYSPVRIWDLDSGIYRLKSNSFIKYKGATDDTNFGAYGDGCILIVSYNSNSDAKYWWIFSGGSNIPVIKTLYIFNGYTTQSTGVWYQFKTSSSYEEDSNKVTAISSSSTNTQYPSAKAVYDYVEQHGGGTTITYGTTDLTPGVSPLAEGEFYFVYE